MLFTSFEFFLVFLPSVFITFFYLNSRGMIVQAKIALILFSLGFYSWWKIEYLPLIIFSIVFNYGVGLALSRSVQDTLVKKSAFVFGIVVNIFLLGYYKYADFLIENMNFAMNSNLQLLNIALPLAISYFTFQQIAFLVDSYRGETKEYSFINYAVFISFFPQLLMGPIMHHKEIIPQFERGGSRFIQLENVSLGLFLFSVGLAKKTILGDPLTGYAQDAFNHAQSLSMLEAWYSSLSYVLSYYFDLSGYADMAIGLGKMFNVDIPLNFNSPYKSRNFAEYWRRWHMTLSRFLGDYVYKSLGGNRKIAYVFYINILLTFLVSGVWHGAGWTFVVWGLVNGLFVVMSHMMRRSGLELNFCVAWLLTFLGVVLTRVLFVSDNFEDAWYVLCAMVDPSKFETSGLKYIGTFQIYFMFPALAISLFGKNSIQISERFVPSLKYAIITVCLIGVSMCTFVEPREFLYFQF